MIFSSLHFQLCPHSAAIFWHENHYHLSSARHLRQKYKAHFCLIKVAMHQKLHRGKNKKTHVFDYFQTQCFYAFLEWIEALLWSQKQSFKNSVVEVPIPFPKYTQYLHHLWYEVDKMTCQRKAEWCANFLSTWKVQKSAFHCFVINPQLAPGGLRMPISILCFGKGPCAAALRLRPFISRLKGEAGRGEEEQFQRHTLVCQSRPSKTFSYEKKIFHQCSSSLVIRELEPLTRFSAQLTCDDDQWDALEITAEERKTFVRLVFYLPPS